MDVEVVQSWRVAITGELDLEFQLVLRHGELAERAGSPDPRATPRVDWLAAGQLPTSKGFSRFFAKQRFVRHLATPILTALRGLLGRAPSGVLA